MDFSLTPAQEAFRQEVGKWGEENIPGDWGTPAWPNPTDIKERVQVLKAWRKKLHEKGWSGITWPKEYGGKGSTPIEDFIFKAEMARWITPPNIASIGVSIAGPTIMAWGTDEQKARYVPKILSADEIWCQGFSEPNSGSDLASLQTRADDAGDKFIVNGQKIWTSYAQYADYCVLLTRSSASDSPHKGMTYLIVDMKTPGITVKPLKQVTGTAEFNEMFFQNVEVPKANVLGQEGNGWIVAMTTLAHERVNIAGELYGTLLRGFERLVKLARNTGDNGHQALKDPTIRKKLLEIWRDVELQRLNNLRMRANLGSVRDNPGPIGSIFKLLFADTNQRAGALALEILGPYGQLNGNDPRSPDEGIWPYAYLRARGNSIEGGTSEILLGVIGDRILGLPR